MSRYVKLFGLALALLVAMMTARPVLAGAIVTRLKATDHVVFDYVENGVAYHSEVDQTFALVSVDGVNDNVVTRVVYEQNTYLASDGSLAYHATGSSLQTSHILLKNEVGTFIAMQEYLYTGQTQHTAQYLFVVANGELRIEKYQLDGQQY
jgi:hypothetical protein